MKLTGYYLGLVKLNSSRKGTSKWENSEENVYQLKEAGDKVCKEYMHGSKVPQKTRDGRSPLMYLRW